MTFQLTTSQALKSFAGAAILGLGMDALSLVSCPLSDEIYFALREVSALLFWSILSGWHPSHLEIFRHSVYLAGCPLDLLQLLGSLLHLLGSAL